MVDTVQKMVPEDGCQVAKCAALVRPGSAHLSTGMQAGWLFEMFLHPKTSLQGLQSPKASIEQA